MHLFYPYQLSQAFIFVKFLWKQTRLELHLTLRDTIRDTPLNWWRKVVGDSEKNWKKKEKSSSKRDLNPQPPDDDVCALPLNYNPITWMVMWPSKNKNYSKETLNSCSSSATVFPSLTICPSLEKPFKAEILSKYTTSNGTGLTADHLRLQLLYPNVSNLTGHKSGAT